MSAAVSVADFERIVGDYETKLRVFAQRMTRSREDAEEIVQDAFLRAYRALERMPENLRQDLRLKAWLYTITLNVARNRLHKKSPVVVSLDDVDDPARFHSLCVERETPESALDERASLEAVESALLCVPEHMRATARLKFLDGRTHREIAMTFHRPIGTVKSHVRRAAIIMRRRFTLQHPAIAA
ncbi:MAG: sigma-70 family RNA polymerase sigma factor [Candidatus Cybelea sp.]